MNLRVLITVTHLLGAGHLTRAAALARAFVQAGHETTLVSGGYAPRPTGLDGVSFIQLPPVRTMGTDFKTLLDENNTPIDTARLEERRGILLQTVKETRPDIVITELFPFGRRVLADEFTGLLDAARELKPRPLILCSIRDILASPSKPERIEEAHRRLLRDYDAALVHGDPRLVPLEATWPVDERIRPLIRYTGYVDENQEPVRLGTRQGVLVSGGSSAASLPLYRAAIEASHAIPGEPWRILIGRGVADADFQALKNEAPAHVTVERARPDFRALLAGAKLSVSQAGYNTTVDLLRTGVTSVLVPFEGGHETEQRLRAERLKALGLAEIVPESGLSPEGLAEAIRQGLSRNPADPPALSLDGAQQSVALAERLFLSRPALQSAIDWSPVDEALRKARDREVAVRFWWRDDDAVADTPQLERLLDLARSFDVGLALAVIPKALETSLAQRLSSEERVSALVHGWAHANHAPEGQKKAEFGSHRPVDAMAAQTEQALHVIKEQLGSRFLPVFVPPWNRISPDLLPHLPGLGFECLSTFGDRKAAYPAEGLLQINTHIDPIDWHGTRSLADPAWIVATLAQAIERRITGDADRNEPIGFLTHHLVHDDVIWSLCERLMVRLALHGFRFIRTKALF